MKKIFTFCAAVLASVSMWAAAPDFESFNWGADDFATVFADHDGIVISSDASAWKGNFGGIQYVALGGGTDMSAASPTPYFGVTAAAGIDSVEIYWAPNGTDASNLAWIAWDDAANFKQQEVDYKGEGPEYTGNKSIDDAIWQKFDFSATDEKAILFGRQLKKVAYEGSQYQFGKNKTVNILGVRVWLHETKTIVSTVETLTDAKINGVALDPNFLSELTETGSVEVFNAYTTAPTVTFTKHVVITYDDSSTKQSDVDVEVVAEELGSNQWTANITLNGADDYSITMQRAAAYTVTYKLADETVLGTEVVAAGGHPAEYAQYETMPLAEFQGWYTDAELTSEADLTAAVNADLTLYGKFVKAYAQSLNIEQLVLDESTGADIASILTNHGFAYAHIDALDTLNDLENKTNRNYAFLGLKLKTAGAYIQFHLQAGKTLAVKFGNLTKPIAVTIDGVAQANHTEGAFLLEAAEADRLIELKTTDKSTVVLQQIMIGEPIAEVTLPDPGAYLITIAESENGTVTANWDNKKYRTPVGATVTLTFTPAEGNIVMSCTVNGTEIHQSAPGAAITFEMPAEDVTITTTFSIPTALENAEAAVKAEKVIRDGQVLILRDGKIFNALGAEVK